MHFKQLDDMKFNQAWGSYLQDNVSNLMMQPTWSPTSYTKKER
jgi:hypothetical protein